MTKKRAGVIALAFFMAIFSSCTFQKQKKLVIWTDRREIASYIEVFNASQNKTKAIVVFKENLAVSLPPAKDEENPDLVLGSWLKNSRTMFDFIPLDYLFLDLKIKPKDFYSELLSYGSIFEQQYLLPVSFNLPAVIFSNSNEKLIEKDFTLTLPEIKSIAKKFNQKNKNGIFTKIGFAPTWNSDFLYLDAKINGFSVKQKGIHYIWNTASIEKTVDFLKEWTKDANENATIEQDFAFKYLYTPDYKFVDEGHCLFAFTTVSSLFDTPSQQLEHISFRWISTENNSSGSQDSQNIENVSNVPNLEKTDLSDSETETSQTELSFQKTSLSKLPVEDDIVMLGIYKNASNKHGANSFIRWIFNEDTQKALLWRTREMNLRTQTFGIFGGFSSLKNVNERTFPSFYQNLLGNIPKAGTLLAPATFPTRWESLKERVLIPFLTESVVNDFLPEKSLEEKTLDWTRNFN